MVYVKSMGSFPECGVGRDWLHLGLVRDWTQRQTNMVGESWITPRLGETLTLRQTSKGYRVKSKGVLELNIDSGTDKSRLVSQEQS